MDYTEFLITSADITGNGILIAIPFILLLAIVFRVLGVILGWAIR